MSFDFGFDLPCSHVCHKRGLNPWVKSCPVCGCANPKYDPEAKSDIVMPEVMPLEQCLGIFATAHAQIKARRKSRRAEGGGGDS